MTYFIILYVLTSVAVISGADTRGFTADIPNKSLRTLDEFQDSLLSRRVNLNSLRIAFYPTNRQKSVSIDVNYYFCDQFNNGSFLPCNDLVRYVEDMNSGRVPDIDHSGNFSFKFRWYSSPVSLFIRPALLSPLSLYIYRINVPIAHIVLDGVDQDMLPVEGFEREQNYNSKELCNNVCSALKLLNQLTSDVSFYGYRAIR